MSDRVFHSGTTPEGVIHYPHLLQPDTKGEYADGKYKLTLAMPRAGSDFSKLMALVVAAARQEWGADVDLNKVKKPFHDGDAGGDPHMAGKVVLKMKTANKPIIVGLDRKPLPPTEDPVHAGDFAIANVTACAYVQGGNKGVSFWFSGIMLTKRGERIGGVSADKLFEGAPRVAPDGVRSDDPTFHQTRLRDPAPVANTTASAAAAAPADLSLF